MLPVGGITPETMARYLSHGETALASVLRYIAPA